MWLASMYNINMLLNKPDVFKKSIVGNKKGWGSTYRATWRLLGLLEKLRFTEDQTTQGVGKT